MIVATKSDFTAEFLMKVEISFRLFPLRAES